MGVMGLNLAMNAAEKGFKVAVFNRTTSRMENAVKIAQGQKLHLHGFPDMKDFVKSLEKPRKTILLVQAGAAVDATLKQLLELLEEGDIVIDGGNEFYLNTDRRAELAKTKGIEFFGMGVSGGEEGARHGPALMPGGSKKSYEAMSNIFTAIAAKSKTGPCVDFMGNGSAGNYVKMVHNGIEYGDMELIAESYSLLRNLAGLHAGAQPDKLPRSNTEIATIFEEWNNGRMASYLIEITAIVLKTPHPNKEVTQFLLDDVLDVAGAKGTGKWTAQEACEKGVACPSIQAALDARNISGMCKERQEFYKLFHDATADQSMPVPELSLGDIETALFLSKLCCYAQGLALIKEASRLQNYNVDLAKVARCWTGGCIIRANLLADIMEAYKAHPDLANLLAAPEFAKHFTSSSVTSWKKVVSAAISQGVSVPAMTASLNWFLMLAAGALPLNLVQAQRDYFGAHTFRLLSAAGATPMHADWEKGEFTQAP